MSWYIGLGRTSCENETWSSHRSSRPYGTVRVPDMDPPPSSALSLFILVWLHDLHPRIIGQPPSPPSTCCPHQPGVWMDRHPQVGPSEGKARDPKARLDRPGGRPGPTPPGWTCQRRPTAAGEVFSSSSHPTSLLILQHDEYAYEYLYRTQILPTVRVPYSYSYIPHPPTLHLPLT